MAKEDGVADLLEQALLRAARTVEIELARIVKSGEDDLDRRAQKFAEAIAKAAIDSALGTALESWASTPGSEVAMMASAPAGSRIVFLTGAEQRLAISDWERGLELQWSLGPNRLAISLSRKLSSLTTPWLNERGRRLI